MAKLPCLNRFQQGPPLDHNTVPPQTNNNNVPPSPMNRMICMGIAVAWTLTAVTPLFASVGLQNGPKEAPPRLDSQLKSVLAWDALQWDTPRARFAPNKSPSVAPVFVPSARDEIAARWPDVTWDTQPTRKTPIPDVHDSVLVSRTSSLPIGLWPQSDWDTQTTRKLVQGGSAAQVDNPPVQTISFPIISRWYEFTVLPLRMRAGYQDGPVPADNPPISGRQDSLSVITGAWELGPPVPQRAPMVIPSGPPPQSDNPPPYKPRLEHVYAQWEPLPWQTVWFTRLITLPLDQPFRRDWLPSVIDSWTSEQTPQQRRAVVTPSGPTIIPQQAFVRDLSLLQTTWISNWYEQPIRVFLVQQGPPPQADNPPVSSRQALFSNITGLWEPGPPIPQRVPTVTPSGPEPVPPPTINYQNAGDGPKKERHKKRRTHDDLFAELEQTIRETMAGPVVQPTARQVQPVVQPLDLTVQCLARLRRMAEERTDLQQRVAALARALDDYLLAQDEDDWMML